MIKKFSVAINGLILALKDKNVQLQIVIALIVCIFGFVFKITKFEFLVVLLCCALIISLEIINTCIEKICDFICPEQNDKIKIIKDMSSGFVLVAAIIVAIIGLMIFLPYIGGLL